MELYGRATGSEIPRADPDTGLEEPMWQMGLGGGDGAGYPERPGEPDCPYYMRHGTCGYGERCRYNHPRDRNLGGGTMGGGVAEYPERVGQPVCQYFLRTGTCKFGPTCKYHHPRQGGGFVRPVSLNYYGYPLRPGEKECSYYVRTGQCKFGSTCKFHHPQPTGVSVPSAVPTFYPTIQSPSVPPAQPYTTMTSWQVARPSVLPASYMQGSYGPVLLSPGVVPVPGWSTYPPPASHVVSPSGQQTVQEGSVYGLSSQMSPSASAYSGSYPPMSSSVGPSSTSIHKENIFPERPGQPECQFYMRTGDCKYGSTCRYHHPQGWGIPKTNCTLSPMGLPLRPGAPPCAFYAQHGICKFGPTCKFDHPMGGLSYCPSASSLVDIPVSPYPVGISMATLAPSSSSAELLSELPSNKDPFSTLVPSSENLASGSIGPIFSKGGSSMAQGEKSSSN